MRITTSRRLLDAVHGLHEAETLEDLGAAFRRGVAPLVPADLHEIFVFGTGDAADDLWLGSPGGYSASERAELLDYLDETPEQHPIIRHWEKHGTKGPLRISDLISLRTWRRREFYQLFNRRWSHDFEMAALLEGVTPSGIAGFTVVRATKDITDAEMVTLRELQRPLAVALRRLLGERSRRRALRDFSITPGQVAAACPSLTKREAEVLCWICEGKTDAEIAGILTMSKPTVSTHVGRILRKLDADNRLSAALYVIRRTLAAD